MGGQQLRAGGSIVHRTHMQPHVGHVGNLDSVRRVDCDAGRVDRRGKDNGLVCLGRPRGAYSPKRLRVADARDGRVEVDVGAGVVQELLKDLVVAALDPRGAVRGHGHSRTECM